MDVRQATLSIQDRHAFPHTPKRLIQRTPVAVGATCFYSCVNRRLTMRFTLGLLLGYCIRGRKPLLSAAPQSPHHNLNYQLGANDSHDLHKRQFPRSSVWTTRRRKLTCVRRISTSAYLPPVARLQRISPPSRNPRNHLHTVQIYSV